MSSVSLAFFTLDLGTASTAVSLVAPFGGRFRLLASCAAPSGVDLEAMLEDLVRRVDATEPGLLDDVDGWADWARVASVTRHARRVACVGASAPEIDEIERAFAAHGWMIGARIVGERLDPMAATHICLDPDLDAVAIASPAQVPDRDPLRPIRARMGPLLAAVAHQRPSLPLLMCGNPADWAGLPVDRTVRLPAARGSASSLRAALVDLGAAATPGPVADGDARGPATDGLPDGRMTIRQAVATLAQLLDRRIEAVDVGHSASTRVLADATGTLGHLVAADAALVPAVSGDDASGMDDVTRWSAIRADPFSLADRFRNLRVSPWRDLAGDGGRLRLAALRSALARLDRRWRDELHQPAPAPDMLICAGGAFAAVPPPAAAMAVVDGMRRPGALTMFHDHARLLGPIGALPDEGDRRRLLVDLLDDALLPLGSAIVIGEVRDGSRGAALRVTSRLQQHELELAPNAVRLVDLPPGVPARVEVELRDGQALGVRARRIALDVTGGLGGLLVDTREVPLRLPDRVERRRALLESWERPIWGADQ